MPLAEIFHNTGKNSVKHNKLYEKKKLPAHSMAVTRFRLQPPFGRYAKPTETYKYNTLITKQTFPDLYKEM